MKWFRLFVVISAIYVFVACRSHSGLESNYEASRTSFDSMGVKVLTASTIFCESANSKKITFETIGVVIRATITEYDTLGRKTKVSEIDIKADKTGTTQDTGNLQRVNETKSASADTAFVSRSESKITERKEPKPPNFWERNKIKISISISIAIAIASLAYIIYSRARVYACIKAIISTIKSII